MNTLFLETNPTDTGSTYYAVFWNSSGQAWNPSTNAYATYTTTRDTWDVPMTESPSGTGIFQLTIPVLLTPGVTRYSMFKRAGGSPSHASDVRYISGSGYWTGTDLLDESNVMAVSGLSGAVARDGSLSVANHGCLPHQPVLPDWTESPAATYFVRADGDDVNNSGAADDDAFATIARALTEKTNTSAASAIIDVGPLTIASSVVLPARVWLRGDGVVTMTYNSSGIITSGSWSGTSILTISSTSSINLTAGNDSVITGIKLVSSPSGPNGYSYPLGYKGNGTASRGVVVRDVWVVGDSDASYFSDFTACNGFWRHYNCIFDSKFDSTQILGSSISHVSHYYNCILRATGPTAVTGGQGDTRGITATGGEIVAWNCLVVATGHITGKTSIGVLARSNARIYLIGGSVSGEDDDLVQEDLAVLGRAGVVSTGSTSGDITNLDVPTDWARYMNVTATKDFTNTTISEDQVVVSSGGTPVSPYLVDKDHTWRFNSPNQTTAPNILSEIIGFDGLVAMDFTEPMPALTSISTVSSASFANIAGTEPTVGDLTVSADKKKAHVEVDASAATAGTYTLTVTIVTADGQTFARAGRLTVT